MTHKPIWPIPADKHFAFTKFYVQGTQWHSGHVFSIFDVNLMYKTIWWWNLEMMTFLSLISRQKVKH